MVAPRWRRFGKRGAAGWVITTRENFPRRQECRRAAGGVVLTRTHSAPPPRRASASPSVHEGAGRADFLRVLHGPLRRLCPPHTHAHAHGQACVPVRLQDGRLLLLGALSVFRLRDRKLQSLSTSVVHAPQMCLLEGTAITSLRSLGSQSDICFVGHGVPVLSANAKRLPAHSLHEGRGSASAFAPRWREHLSSRRQVTAWSSPARDRGAGGVCS